MATLDTSVALDMAGWNLGNPTDGYVGAHDHQHFTVKHANGYTYDFGGHAFDYFGFGPFVVPDDGTVHSMTVSHAGSTALTLTGVTIDIPTLYGFYAADQFDALMAYLFARDDSITGSPQDDVLYGFTGDDKIHAGAGADTLKGGLGADRLLGAAGADKFVFDSALDSTSVVYDRIADFDASNDSFVFDSAVTGIDADIATGKLGRFFDENLADAADDSHLGANHAVLFTPDAGKHAGQTFLIVDLNGDAGYQIGEDAVIRLVDTSHLAGLGTANFTT